jgi:hypothetical protein
MEDNFDFDEIEKEYEGVDFEEDHPVEVELIRVKSLILLTIFILPTILIVIEVLTGGVSGVISPGKGEPIITPDRFPSVHF